VDRLEDLRDRLRLTLGAQDGTPLVALGAQDLALLVALGGQDLGLAKTFGGEDGGALLPFGAHLLLHRVLDRLRRVDRLDLDAGYPDAPLS